MANVNKVLLMGNLTRDPELKYLPSQTAICDFSLAINRTWTGQDGVKKEEVTFVDCSAFGKVAETISKHFTKGKPIFVEGRLKLDQWEAQDGSKRSKMRVVVEGFTFLPRDNGGGGEGGGYRGEPEERGGGRPQRQASRGAQEGVPRGNGVPARGAGGGGGNKAKSMMDAPTYDAGDVDDLPPLSDEDIPF